MPKPHDKLPNVLQATVSFEKWAARHVNLIKSDVALKHRDMAEAPFPFFRATFYRWAQWWPLICPELARATQVLAVGDLHVDNFGTWRDIEGRLIWGVNDFDEAWPAAYTVDLVRLLTSCYLSIEDAHLSMSRKEACDALEQGYRDSISKGGSPFVLAEHHRWLRLLATNKLRDPVLFWKKIDACPKFKGKLPDSIHSLLEKSLPHPRPVYELKFRVAGLGSLGHPRVLAVSSWHGSHVAREAKQLTPSAWIWASDSHSSKILGRELVDRAVRIRDPHVHFSGHWVIRRLAPYCSHIEIDTLPAERDEEKLLYCMGWETANIHLGTPKSIPALKRDLAKRKSRWLHKAAKSMLKVTLDDWSYWRRKWQKLPTLQ